MVKVNELSKITPKERIELSDLKDEYCIAEITRQMTRLEKLKSIAP